MKKRYKLVRTMLAVAAVGALLLFLTRIQIPGESQWALRWNSAPQSDRDLWAIVIGIIVALLTSVPQFVVSLLQFRKNASTQSVASDFPFERFSTNNIDALKAHRKQLDLPYQPRFLPAQQNSFEKSIDAQFLLLTGRRGLGKTRECIELFTRLARSKGEEVIIIYPKTDDFDRPRDMEIPADFSPRTLILFIDEIESRLGPRSGRASAGGAPARAFFDRLTATIEWMKERYAARDWRVVLTAVDEPANLEALQLDSERWSKFQKYQLRGIHRNARASFAQAVGKNFGLVLDNSALARIVTASDGTPAGIIIPLAQEAANRKDDPSPISRNDLRRYEFRYPMDWTVEVYDNVIAPFPARRAVFEALATLRQLRIKPRLPLVADLAARLFETRRFVWLKKRTVMRTVSQDLRAWMFTYEGELICPTAYLPYQVDLASTFPRVLSSIRFAIRRRALFDRLMPDIASVYHVAADLGFHSEYLGLLRMASRRAPHFAPFSVSTASLLGQMGKYRESLVAAETAVRIDPQNSLALISLASAQGRTGLHDEAVVTATRATEVAPKHDFAWLNLGVLLSKLGAHEEAISALETACALNPQSARAWYSLGVSYDRFDRHVEAVDACRTATALDPHNADAWHTLGIAYDRSGDARRSVTSLQQAQRANPGDGTIWLSLGRAFVNAGQRGEAFDALVGAETRAVGDPELLTRISVQFGINGWRDQAVSAAEKALDIQPERADAARSFAFNFVGLADASNVFSDDVPSSRKAAEQELIQKCIPWLTRNQLKRPQHIAWPGVLALTIRLATDDAALRSMAWEWLAASHNNRLWWTEVWGALVDTTPTNWMHRDSLVATGREWLVERATKHSAASWPTVVSRLLRLCPDDLVVRDAAWAWLLTTGLESTLGPMMWRRLYDKAGSDWPHRKALLAMGQQWFVEHPADFGAPPWPSVVSRLLRELPGDADLHEAAWKWLETGGLQLGLGPTIWKTLSDKTDASWPHRQALMAVGRQWFLDHETDYDAALWPNIVSQLLRQFKLDSRLRNAAWEWLKPVGLKPGAATGMWDALVDTTDTSWSHCETLLGMGMRWFVEHETDFRAASWANIVSRLLRRFPADAKLREAAWGWLENVDLTQGTGFFLWRALYDTEERASESSGRLRRLGAKWIMICPQNEPHFASNWEAILELGEQSDEFLDIGFSWAKDRIGEDLASFIIPKLLALTDRYSDFFADLVSWLKSNEVAAPQWSDKLMIVLKTLQLRGDGVEEELYARACRHLAGQVEPYHLWGPIWVSLYDQRQPTDELIRLGGRWVETNREADAWASTWLRLSEQPDRLDALAEPALDWLATTRLGHNKWPEVWKRLWIRSGNCKKLGPLAIKWLHASRSRPRHRDAWQDIWSALWSAGYQESELRRLGTP